MGPHEGVPIDRGWAWCTVIGCFVNHVFVIGGARSYGIIFVNLTERFNASSTLASWSVGLMMFGVCIYSPVAAVLSRMYTFRLVAMVGATAQGLSFVIAAFLPNIYGVAFVIGIVDGFGVGFLFSTSISCVGQYFIKKRSLAIGISATGYSVGQLVLPFLIRFLLDNYGYRGCMMIYGAVTWNSLVAASLFRPQTFYTRKCTAESNLRNSKDDARHVANEELKSLSNSLASICNVQHDTHHMKDTQIVSASEQEVVFSTLLDNEHDDNNCRSAEINGERRDEMQDCPTEKITSAHNAPMPDPSPQQGTNAAPEHTYEQNGCHQMTKTLGHIFRMMFDKALVRNSNIMVCSMATGFVNTSLLTLFVLIPAYAKEIGLSKQQAALIVSISGVADFIGKILGAVLNNLQCITTRTFLCLVLAASVVPSVVCLFMPSFTSLAIHASLFTMFAGMYIGLFPVYLLEIIGPGLFPSAFALALVFIGVGNLSGPLIAGAVFDTVGSYLAPMWMCVGLLIVGTMLFVSQPLISRLSSCATASSTETMVIMSPTM